MKDFDIQDNIDKVIATGVMTIIVLSLVFVLPLVIAITYLVFK